MHRLRSFSKKHLPNFSTVPSSLSPESSASYKPIFVAATRQNVGKTSVSLALLSGLQKRFQRRVGFIKPVGQKHVIVEDESGEPLKVDKDAAVVKQYFHLDHIPYRNTSPVLIPKGYTRDYLDQKINNNQQMDTIKNAFQSISGHSDIVLCEGTGHVAVGSIIDQNNASCAKMLGASVVLVANGGLGNSFDELQLNRAMCEAEGVDVAGVIINKVLPDKYDQTKHYVSKALEQKWGSDVPLLGCIPDRPFLGSPALSDLERLFDGSIVSGTDHRLRHFRIDDISLVATSLNVFLKSLRSIRQAETRKLFVCHASRNDILLGYLMESVQRILPTETPAPTSPKEFSTAMVVTGCGEYPISTQVLEIIASLPKTSPPVLLTEAATDDVLSGMYNFTPKLNSEDEHRVESTITHYEPYIDFDALLDQVRIPV